MQFMSIASGSSGNCLYAGSDDTHILLDAGISKKRIEEGLKSSGIEPKDIQGILVTHEHMDHIQGIGVWSRKYHVPIYGTRGTLKAMLTTKSLGKVDEELFREIRPDEAFSIGDLEIHPFSMPHDASDPVSYRVTDGQMHIGTVTDLGYVTNKVEASLKNCDLLYVEANHDIRMLELGPYPYQLKRRILGNYGHLCNEVSGRLIGHLLNERLQHILLGHLSKENNYPDLALQAVLAELKMGFDFDESIPVVVADRDKAMPLIHL